MLSGGSAVYRHILHVYAAIRMISHVYAPTPALVMHLGRGMANFL